MEIDSVPHCVGFIMDGNRRWAEADGQPRLSGHAKGFETFKNVCRWVHENGIPHAVFFAFSTENWKRSAEEVEQLLRLFETGAKELQHQVQHPSEDSEQGLEQFRIRFIGRREDFSPALQEQMRELEQASAQHLGTTIWVALSYGGRAELVAAINESIAAGVPVDEYAFRQHLWSAELPDVDLLIRTSGEARISNFLPWQLSYSEFYFTPTHWPAFTKSEFTRILVEYAGRQRRHGT